jgi:hypothetical protein
MKWLPIADFHKYTPMFYVGHNGIIDNAECYKYKGNIPDYLEWFLPLDGVGYSELD